MDEVYDMEDEKQRNELWKNGKIFFGRKRREFFWKFVDFLKNFKNLNKNWTKKIFY